MNVTIPEEFAEMLDETQLVVLREILQQDPRPGYQHDPLRVYGFEWAGMEIRFKVTEGNLTVTEILRNGEYNG